MPWSLLPGVVCTTWDSPENKVAPVACVDEPVHRQWGNVTVVFSFFGFRWADVPGRDWGSPLWPHLIIWFRDDKPNSAFWHRFWADKIFLILCTTGCHPTCRLLALFSTSPNLTCHWRPVLVIGISSNSLAISDQVWGEKGALKYKSSSTFRFWSCSSAYTGLIQIPGLGSRVSQTRKRSVSLDLISYSSSFLCHSPCLPILFMECSPVPLKSTSIFTAMMNNNTFSKAIGKSTWKKMHHPLL